MLAGTIFEPQIERRLISFRFYFVLYLESLTYEAFLDDLCIVHNFSDSDLSGIFHFIRFLYERQLVDRDVGR